MPETSSAKLDSTNAAEAADKGDSKKKLKRLRQRRTLRRKRAREDIAKIEGLDGESPTFPEDRRPDVMLQILAQHQTYIREIDNEVSELLEDDAVLTSELTEVEAFDAEIDVAIAAITAARDRMARPSHVGEAAETVVDNTFYGTPEATRTVRFKPLMNSTLSNAVKPSNATRPGTPRAPGESAALPPPSAPIASTVAARLPRELDISPEVFTGDRLKYRAFITQFKCFVNKRPDATPMERLMTLRKFVSGEPKQIVHALELSDANYDVALELLDENYARIENETEKILSDIRNLPRVSRPQDLPALRKLVTFVQSSVATLAANRIPLAAFALTLRASIMAAMPARMRQEFKDAQRWERRFIRGREETSDEQTTEEGEPADDGFVAEKTSTEVRLLIDFLRTRIRDWEDNNQFDGEIRPTNNRDGADRHGRSGPDRRPKSTIAATTSRPRSAAAPKFRPRPCLFCKTTEHNSSRCPAQIPYERRREILAADNRCERCFRSSHASQNDCRGPRASCLTCRSAEHYTSMHPDRPATSSAIVAGSGSVGVDASTLLWTACAYVVNGGLRIPIRVFLDNGSTLTVISPSLRAMLREPPVAVNNLSIQAFASTHACQAVSMYNIRLQGSSGGSAFEFLAHEYEFAVDPANSSPGYVTEAIRKFNTDHPLADRSYVGEWNQSAPLMLIGMDQLHKIIIRAPPERIVDNIEGQPTHLGWVVGGSVKPGRGRVDGTVTAAHIVCCPAVLAACSSGATAPAKALQTLWDLDAVGIAEKTTTSTLSADEESAIQQFNDGVTYENNRYTVVFPKRETISRLPNNRQAAERRLERKLFRLQTDPIMYRRYHEELMKFVSAGYARELDETAGATSSAIDGSYYMPHHEVITGAGATEKWRIVFDCSARERGATSLNCHLLSGPNLCPDLVSLLLNFRVHPVAVSADIAKAYMMIAVSPEDRPLFRFLWKAPGTNTVRQFEMQRVTWGAASSGFLLAATVRHHLKKSDPASQALGDCLYADDFLQSFEDAAAASEFTDRVRATLETAGMSLAKWKTNSDVVTDHLLATGVDARLFDTTAGDLLKVLGISWCPKTDVFRFAIPASFDGFNTEDVPTKRKVLSIVASVYDPIGWLMPFTLRGKRLIQRMWSADLEWNQKIPADVHRDLSEWISEFRAFTQLQIPRQYVCRREHPTAHRLHVFGDASKVAYACAAYLEARYESGSSAFALVMSKSRLAPRDSPTLPRLELLASVLAVRLKNFLVERMSVQFERVLFYTDSTITYHWTTSTNPGSWRPFVSNRVKEIQAGSRREDWFLVRGADNISDLATRGVTARALTDSSGWWFGPDWLHLPRESQPISRPSLDGNSLDPVKQELRVVVAPVVVVQPLVNLDRYSSASRAVRVMCNVVRFCHLVRRQPIPLAAALYRNAENELIRWCQQQHFKTEINRTLAKEKVSASSKLAAFSLFIDEAGLLRARTRLTQGPFFTYDERNPIVVAGESRLAKLLVADAHRVNAHFGVNNVLTQLRRRFWITRGRQIIKAVLRRCVTCRRKQGATATQVEAPLPECRADLQVPFRVAGVDFCGPFYTRSREGTSKTFVALFTCTSTRAVHLEAVTSQSTPQTHLALRRFLAAYPGCVRFISDNGRSFVKASTDLKRMFNSVKDRACAELLSGRVVDWSFNCARASWHGGFFERMVGVAKSALHKTLGRSLVDYEEFRTILSELAAVINDRPITHAPSEDDAPVALTPSQFLRGGPHSQALASLTPIDRLGTEQIASGDELREGAVQRTRYFRDLSVRWFREYILLLRSANTTKGNVARPMQVGEICLLKEDNEPRIRWKLVRVLERHEGRDGQVRTYTVLFPNHRTSRRAAQLLIPLEVGIDQED